MNILVKFMTSTFFKTPIFYHLLVIVILSTLASCTGVNEKSITEIKFYSTDPFQKDIVQSQFFDIDGKKENVIEGKDGTVIFVPKGAFVYASGKVVDENIKIELAEALSPSDMILANLTTTSDGKLLETDGMIYFNATSNGEKLKVNSANPVYIEIPTDNKKPGMMAYEGVRDEKGNMNWINPQPIKTYLIPVDMSLLDFLPEGFEAEVNKGLVFFGKKAPSKEFSDSLYFSLSPRISYEGKKVTTDINEPFYNKHNQVKDGKYTKESFERYPGSDSLDREDTPIPQIDPAIIKVLHSDKFNNTLIATREFEKRLQYIFKTCNNNIIEIYINNLDKDLWVLDSLAAENLAGNNLQERFREFSKEKLTNVKDAEKSYAGLKKYYDKKLREVKEELEAAKRKAIKELERKDKEAEKVVNEYRNVLWKREKYRMEKYGFQWTKTGWMNIDIGVRPKDWKMNRLDMIVKDIKNFDRTYCYVVYSSLQSIYRLNNDGDSLFYVGNNDQKEMLMPIKKKALAVAVAYKNEDIFFEVKEFETVTDEKIDLTPVRSSKEEFKKLMNSINKDYTKENKIAEDLKFMEFFYKENKRQEQLKKVTEFERNLRRKAFPCCNDNQSMEAAEIYSQNCAICHGYGEGDKVGPGLVNIRKRRSMDWLIRFTRNSDKVKAEGDTAAVNLANKYGGMQMPMIDLSDCEIEKIFEYLDNLPREER